MTTFGPRGGGRYPTGERQVQNEREPADRSDTHRGAGHGIGEVVPSQPDDADSDHTSQHARRGRDQYRQPHCPGRPRRAEKQYRDGRGQREHAGGMPARIAEDAQIGAVDQGLEQPVVQSYRGRDGCRGQHGAVKPAGEQAGDDDGRAQHHGRNLGTRSGQPGREALMAAEPGDDRRIDGMIKSVRPGLMREDQAEDGDEDGAAGQQRPSPGTSGGGQQGPAVPSTRAVHAAPVGWLPVGRKPRASARQPIRP